MKKYFLMLATTLIAALSLTNCRYDAEDLESGCWKLTEYETLLLDWDESDMLDKYIYFEGGYIYFGERWRSTWEVKRSEYSLDGKKIVASNGESHKLTKGGELMNIKLGTGVKATYSKSTIPTEMMKAIQNKDYTEIDYFDFEGTLDLSGE